MNRILIDRKLDDLGSKKDDKIVLDIDKDINFIINSNEYNKYVFNIKKGNVNILCILKKTDYVSFEFNVYDGNVSFNNFSYDCKEQKIEANLNKQGALINIYNSYLCKGIQNVDVNVTHKAPSTQSNVYDNAITIEKGSICFNNITKVKKKMKNCKVIQDAKIIPINDNNKNRINPVLLIDEYEVDAKHAAFIGKFKEEQLFYLKSRGLSEQQAIDLLLKGLLVGIMNIEDEEKEKIKDLILKR